MEGEYNFQRTNNRLTNGLTEGNACVSRRIRRPILESHDTRDRCQSVDFRHAFLELRPDRIREVAARTRGCAHASILAYTVAESRKSFLQIRRKAQRAQRNKYPIKRGIALLRPVRRGREVYAASIPLRGRGQIRNERHWRSLACLSVQRGSFARMYVCTQMRERSVLCAKPVRQYWPVHRLPVTPRGTHQRNIFLPPLGSSGVTTVSFRGNFAARSRALMLHSGEKINRIWSDRSVRFRYFCAPQYVVMSVLHEFTGKSACLIAVANGQIVAFLSNNDVTQAKDTFPVDVQNERLTLNILRAIVGFYLSNLYTFQGYVYYDREFINKVMLENFIFRFGY